MKNTESYHGIIINVSQKDRSIFRNLDIIGEKKAALNVITMYKVNVKSEDIENTIKNLQENMASHFLLLIKNFYCHFYRNEELIVVFKDRVFRVTPETSSWNEVIQYGRSLGIPEKQLDFFPDRIEDEEY